MGALRSGRLVERPDDHQPKAAWQAAGHDNSPKASAPMLLSDAFARLGGRALQTRWFVRAPIILYRIGLGVLFGTRLLMLEHLGRRTATRRYVVLEVVDRPAPSEYVIVSGFGDRAQWYRNIRVHPSVRVWCGLRRAAPAIAAPMSEAEAAAVLNRYIHSHPSAWKNLRAAIEHATGAPVDTLPMVLVRLHQPGNPTEPNSSPAT